MRSESPSSTGRQQQRQRRRIASFSSIALAFSVLLIIGIYTDHGLMKLTIIDPATSHLHHANVIKTSHRKLQNKHGENENTVMVEEPNRIWSDRCSKSDILVSQGATAPLPNGIPTYTVEIMNVCVSGCTVSSIHLNCGWFSSARIINPHIFKRLRFNDCLVNDGKPLPNGRTLSFQYANTFRYSLSVASVKC